MAALLEGGGAELAIFDMGESDADAITVEALARLQLLARRHRCRVALRRASPELLALIAFAGLEDILAPEQGAVDRAGLSERPSD